jgi:hypothetical protein
MVQLLRHARACQDAGAILPGTVERVETMTAPDKRRLSSFLWQLYTELAGSVGDDARVLDGIRRSVDAGLFDVRWMLRCPCLDAVRADAAFASLLATVDSSSVPIRAVLEGV